MPWRRVCRRPLPSGEADVRRVADVPSASQMVKYENVVDIIAANLA